MRWASTAPNRIIGFLIQGGSTMPKDATITKANDLVDELSELADAFNAKIDEAAALAVPIPELKGMRTETKSWLKEVGGDVTRAATMVAQGRDILIKAAKAASSSSKSSSKKAAAK